MPDDPQAPPPSGAPEMKPDQPSQKTGLDFLQLANRSSDYLTNLFGELSGLQPLRYPGVFRRLAPEPPKPLRKLGVLFVHGIGDQHRGATLRQFGEPLYSALSQWMEHHDGSAQLNRVSTRDEKIPAAASIQLSYQPPGAEQKEGSPPQGQLPDTAAPRQKPIETEWLLAEAAWAEAFERPSLGNVTFWSLQVVPWLILTQFVDQLSDALREGRFAKAVFSLGYLVFTFPLALFVQLLVISLLPLAIIRPLRPIVAPMQRWISGAIGDTYVLLTSRFQFQSMTTRVLEDLEWLAAQCEVVAVVAHSQGAAIAHEVIRRSRHPKVERFITFGSAVSRLKALRYVTEKAPGMLLASTLIMVATLAIAGVYAWHLLSGGQTGLYAIVGVWVLAVLLAVVTYVMPFTMKQLNELHHKEQDFELSPSVEWDDYYATADPVSNGAMFAGKMYVKSSTEVYNEANVLTDHTTYWRNRDGFTGDVLGRLLSLTGGPFATQSGSLLSNDRRRSRVLRGVAARLLALAVLLLAAFRHPALGAGFTISPSLRWLSDAFARIAAWLVSLIEKAVGVVGSALNLSGESGIKLITVPSTLSHVPWQAACFVVAGLWLLTSSVILKWWERLDTADYFTSVTWSSRASRPGKIWWIPFSVVAAAWLAFWIWWLIVSPRDLWSQIGFRLKPLSGSANNFYWVVLFFFGQVIPQLLKAVKTFKTDEFDRFERIGDHFPSPRPRLADESSSPFEFLKDVVMDALTAIQEWLAARAFNPSMMSWMALGVSLAALWSLLFHWQWGGLAQSGAGLMALAGGVFGWVRARDIPTRLAAGAGLAIGVCLVPAGAGALAGFTTPAGAALLLGGITAAVCALSGAELLRRAWKIVDMPLAKS